MTTSNREPLPFVGGRMLALPLWAQKVFSEMRCREVNDDMASCLNADIRRTAKQVLGQNLTFSDDDLRLLAALAIAAIEHDLHLDLPDSQLIANIERARKARAQRNAEEMSDSSV